MTKKNSPKESTIRGAEKKTRMGRTMALRIPSSSVARRSPDKVWE